MDANPYHFHESSKNIKLDGWKLCASLRRLDDVWVERVLSLGDFLGNNDGNFQWGGQNINQSAQNPTLVYWEGYPILRASLQDNEGNYHQRDCNLSDKIGNGHGRFILDVGNGIIQVRGKYGDDGERNDVDITSDTDWTR
ncbi:hypothetical protein N7466_003789 [Penicillium verhagenii]|uniref:uncharacterized protein n=1 Tax=Penicillium verhagenii TaxID=1562060 RepID=UPI002545B950|nr:uncharacterized protein N7466_003789 [Penicillium verhagenii]KAJ5934242.1 hypothetical protein N7466_003789 [Penicillium verhagenii]